MNKVMEETVQDGVDNEQSGAQLREFALGEFWDVLRALHLKQIHLLPPERAKLLLDQLSDLKAAIGTTVLLSTLGWRSGYTLADSAEELPLPGVSLESTLGADDACAFVDRAGALVVSALNALPVGMRQMVASALEIANGDVQLQAFECAGVGYVALRVRSVTTLQCFFQAPAWDVINQDAVARVIA